jgi:hypothetical protein
MRYLALTLMAVTVVMAVNALADASEGVSFDVSASCTEMGLDDTLEVSVIITIVGNEQSFSILESPVPEIDGFALISTGTARMRSIADSLRCVTVSTTYSLKAQEPGSHKLPVMTLDYVDVTSGSASSLGSASITIIVTPSDTDRSIGLVVLGIIVVVVILASIIVYVKVQRKRKAAVEPPESGTAESQILENLKKADVALAHGKLTDGQLLLFGSLREYIEHRYGLPSDEKDLANALAENSTPNTLCDIYIKLVEWDGELKYGGIPKSKRDISAVIDELRHFLEQSSSSEVKNR